MLELPSFLTGLVHSEVVGWKHTRTQDILSFFVGASFVSCGDSMLEFIALTSYPLDWFDVLDMDNRPVLTEREVLKNLQAIVGDADELPVHEVRTSVNNLHLDL